MKSGTLSLLADEAISHNPLVRKKVLLHCGEVPHVTQVSRVVFPLGEIASSHSHADMWELFLCEKGEGVMTINGREIVLAAGNYVLVEPNEAHEICNTGKLSLELYCMGCSHRRLASV